MVSNENNISNPDIKYSKNDYYSFIKLLDYYNGGMNNSNEYYGLIYSFLKHEFNELDHKNDRRLRDINVFQNKWDEANCFIKCIFKYINKNYNNLKVYENFAKIFKLDEIIETQKFTWQMRECNLSKISPERLFNKIK